MKEIKEDGSKPHELVRGLSRPCVRCHYTYWCCKKCNLCCKCHDELYGNSIYKFDFDRFVEQLDKREAVHNPGHLNSRSFYDDYD